MRVTVRPAPSLWDALSMRPIRNSCRAFMTRDQSEIGLLRQMRWWLTRGPDVLPFLLEEAGHVAGYGIILADGDIGWLSGGLLPDARGRGLGASLFTGLYLHAKREGLHPMLEVLKSNPRAEKLYRNLGFTVIHEDPKLRTMELKVQ